MCGERVEGVEVLQWGEWGNGLKVVCYSQGS